MDSLYDIILSLCNRNGIRPGRLCDELGISRGLITDLKMGRKKSVSAETAQKIAAFFGVSVGYLLGQEEDALPADILEQVDVAFYGDFKELDEEEKEAIRDMVRLMRERRAKN
ncbi:MAG: helix-turn-helix transcriptional regulator [Oscillospiraceae bacterium]|nr:helix-turn-helix transcriptional regulator [Oscillospiraceae bacterium]